VLNRPAATLISALLPRPRDRIMSITIQVGKGSSKRVRIRSADEANAWSDGTAPSKTGVREGGRRKSSQAVTRIL
jgi:hypothetical protein